MKNKFNVDDYLPPQTECLDQGTADAETDQADDCSQEITVKITHEPWVVVRGNVLRDDMRKLYYSGCIQQDAAQRNKTDECPPPKPEVKKVDDVHDYRGCLKPQPPEGIKIDNPLPHWVNNALLIIVIALVIALIAIAWKAGISWKDVKRQIGRDYRYNYSNEQSTMF